MQRVTIDYRRNDVDPALRSLLPSWPRRFWRITVLAVVLPVMVLPFVVLFAWEWRWLSLAYLQGMFFGFAHVLNRNAERQWFKQLKSMPPMELTLRPDGVEDLSEFSLHTLHGWRIFIPLRRRPLIDVLPFQDYGTTLGFFLPRVCFASAAEAESFVQAAAERIAARETAPPIGSVTPFPLPEQARYRWNYQLTSAELFTDEAKAELLKLHPDLLGGAEQKAKPRVNWLYLLVIGLFIGVMYLERLLIEVRSFDYSLVVLVGGFLYIKALIYLQPRILAWFRARRKTPAPPVEVWLSEEGVYRRAAEERLHYPWAGLDALTLHADRLLLWKHDTCRLIIPLRVFDSPEQAHECERWIQGTLQKQFNRLAVAELAEPEPTIELPARPPSNNPYQAPQS